MSESGSSSSIPERSAASTPNTSVLSKAFAHIDLDGHDLPPSPAPSSPRTGRKYALATEIVFTESTDQYNASSTPIYQVGNPWAYYWASSVSTAWSDKIHLNEFIFVIILAESKANT